MPDLLCESDTGAAIARFARLRVSTEGDHVVPARIYRNVGKTLPESFYAIKTNFQSICWVMLTLGNAFQVTRTTDFKFQSRLALCPSGAVMLETVPRKAARMALIGMIGGNHRGHHPNC